MTNYAIDNSDRGDIDRTILWQYDNATHLVALITAFKDFFNEAVTNFWDGFSNRVNLADENKVDDYGLAVWGKILNVSRTIPTSDGPIELPSGLYRKILAAKFKLATENASLKAYSDYVYAIFGGKVKFVDNGTMSLTVEVNENAGELTDEEQALVYNPQIWMIYPAGVESAEHSNSPMFGLDGQQPVAISDPVVGGLNDSSFNWRLTPEGRWND